MSTFTITASYGAALSQEPKVRRMSFGDGYEQRAAFGINRQPRAWALTWEGKNNTDAAAIISFFEARGGVENFSWTPPVGSAGKWVVRSWNRSIVSNGLSNIQATFEEVFEA
jgi:phage-related protein